MHYFITRAELSRMKRHYNMKETSDQEFLQWWRRNHGTGYEKDIRIIEAGEKR